MKRRAKSWDGIISQLRCNDWGIEEISERFLYKSEVQVTPKDVWQRIQGCKGLWAMYKNSPVLVQLADYAAEHGQGVDQEMLEGPAHAFVLFRRSIGECSSRRRNLQCDAGKTHGLHSGIFDPTLPQLSGRGRLGFRDGLSQVFRYGLGPRAENLRNALDPAILDCWGYAF
jgi:hypothetical protein